MINRATAFLFIATATGCQSANTHFPGGLSSGSVLTALGSSQLPCSVITAGSLSELQGGGGTPLGGFDGQRTYRLTRALNQGTWWALSVTDSTDKSMWMRVPFGEPQGCLSTEPERLAQAVSRVGETFIYSPEVTTCNVVEAFGNAPGALLVDADPGMALKVTGVRILAADADGAAEGKVGSTLWYAFGDHLSVRDDTFHGCFSAAGRPSDDSRDDWALRLNTPRGRCNESDGGRHVSCHSTIGAWEGAISPTTLRLSRVNRTVGPLHLWDSHPVDGRRFASTVVEFGIPNGGQMGAEVEALNRAIYASVSRALSEQSANEIRLAEAGDPGVTHRVTVQVSKLQIGRPESRTEMASSRYKSGTRQVDNPEYPRAILRRDEAVMNLDREREAYATTVQQYEETKRVAIEECKRLAAEAKDEAQTYANLGCDAARIAATFVQPSRSDLNSAEQELAASREHLYSTPETITEDVFSDWTYQRTVFERSASAELHLTVQRGTDAPESTLIPFRHDWSDYEVAGDPAHGVTAHQVNRAYLESSVAFVGPIGNQISEVLARRLTTVLRAAGLDAARRAFATQSGAESRVGFEDVDAVAFDAAGSRLGRAEIRGLATLVPNAPFDLPTAALSLRPDECLLVVAVESITNESAGLIVSTPDKRSFDRRGAARAFVEICPEDRDGDAVPAVQVWTASHQTGARFGLYRNKSVSPDFVPQARGEAQ